MGIGSRKILQSEISQSTRAQSAVIQNQSLFGELGSVLNGFIEEPELQGKGWKSAKALAQVYKTVNQTFLMVSEQLSTANQKVIASQDDLLNDQIDEQALLIRIEQNKANMAQLAYANSIWNSTNPGQTNQNNFQNLQRSMSNASAELQKDIDSLDEFDSNTRSVYDDIEHTFSQLSQLLAQVSKASHSSDSKTGTFSTKGIDMKLVGQLDKKCDAYEESKQEKITIKWVSHPGLAGKYPMVYVNGKLDKKRTGALSEAVLKMKWSSIKQITPELLKNLFGVTAFEKLIDPNASLGDQALSLLSLFLTYFPATKVFKLYKGLELAKAGEVAVDLTKIGRAAGLTESELKALSQFTVVETVNVPAQFLKTAERFNEGAIGDYAKTMSANYTQKNIDDLTKLTTHNASSNTALLGKYTEESVTSYEQIAYENGFTYFDAGNQGWADIASVNPQLAYDVNAQFLKEQIKSGKEFVLSDNPDVAMDLFKQLGDKAPSYSKEMEQLREAGYSWVKDGEFWRAIK